MAKSHPDAFIMTQEERNEVKAHIVSSKAPAAALARKIGIAPAVFNSILSGVRKIKPREHDRLRKAMQ